MPAPRHGGGHPQALQSSCSVSAPELAIDATAQKVHIWTRSSGAGLLVDSSKLVPKKLGLLLSRSRLILEYEVPGLCNRAHHIIELQSPDVASESWVVSELRRLRQVHRAWLGGVAEEQLEGFLQRFSEAQPGQATAKVAALQLSKEPSEPVLRGPLIPQEAKELLSLLLGKRSSQGLPKEWLQGWGFEAEAEKSCPYGLRQVEGGPCGVVAPVQASLVVRLMMNNIEPSKTNLVQRRSALLDALTDVLFVCAAESCRGESKGLKVLVLVPPPTVAVRASPAQRLLKGPEGCTVSEFSDWQSLRGAWEKPPLSAAYLTREGSESDADSAGVLLFLYSAMATRGSRQVREDSDLPEEASMIAAHGYCSQEAVNLLLTGVACSNVFDGTKCLGGDDDSGESLLLRGVKQRPQVGFLSLFEAFGSLEVGSLLKRPEWPVWVVHAESHYSLLFGCPAPMDKSGCRLLPSDVTSDVWYYDPLGRQDEEKRITVTPGQRSEAADEDDLESNGMIAKVIRTLWGATADLDWNGSEPIY
ncbi:unnamed protein product [Polarella glacialis]|uniref:Deubiquitinating enzyme MINDY-3/4 conserved domain-containing protein n=1 Tax=Polarella glacialis TaxID=89957 RepID=A0A813GDB0_POLGL|nr:unnamed protein product [Polarella glacialis]